MFTVYILYSQTFEKIYIGYTSNIEERLRSHNELAKKRYTVRYRPWVLIHTETFNIKSEAMAREKALKGGQGRKWIYEVILPRYLSSC